MASLTYWVYVPRLPNAPISKHKTLGEAALDLGSNLFIGETGFVIHKNQVVLAFTKPNPLIGPTLSITSLPLPSPSPLTPQYPTIPWSTTC